MVFDEEDLLLDFSSSTLERARKIRRSGKILQFESAPGGGSINAKVRGSNGEIYKTVVKLSRRKNTLDVEGDCTCPVGFNCKHVAALMLEALERQPKTEPSPAETAARVCRAEPAQPSIYRPEPWTANTLPPNLNEWLRQARQVSQPVEVASSQVLLFILARHNKSLTIGVLSARQNKNGSFGSVRNYTLPDRLDNLAQYVLPDLDLLKLIRTCIGYGYSAVNTLHEPKFASVLLPKLLETGRCYWKNLESPVLKLSEPRMVQPHWQIFPDGTQEATLEVFPPAPVVLPLEPPWYVDSQNGQMGTVQSSFDPQTLKLFLNCPLVQPEAAQAFGQAFAPVADALALPKPQTFSLQTQNVLPLPRIHLYGGKANHWNNSEPFNGLKLSFGYGSIEVPDQTQSPEVNEFKEGVLYRYKRHTPSEKQVRQRLSQEGFMPIGRLNWGYAVSAEQRVDYAMVGNTAEQEQRWLNFMLHSIPKLEALGWQVELDPSFGYHIVQPSEWYGAVEKTGVDWFELELGIMLEGQKLSLLPILLELIRRFPTEFSSAGLAKLPDDKLFFPELPDGRRLALPLGKVRPIVGVLIELYDTSRLKEGRLRLPLLDAARLTDLEDALGLRWFGGEKVLELGRKLANFSGIAPVQPPPTLKANLRPYQGQGLSWLQFLREHELGGVLADDMGLGKTVQTLSHILLEKQSGRATQPSLVIAPTSLAYNWQAEAQRFTPDLKVLVLHGKERKQHFKSLRDYNLIITTYPLILRDFDVLKKKPFHLLVLDEAQYIKNSRSSSTQAVAALKAQHRLCLTGTPLENHLGELWSLFHFLMPGFLGEGEQFRRLYRTPIEKGNDVIRRSQLARRVRPFMLRRDKQSVAKELPPKSEFVVKVELGDQQRNLYETLRTAMHERVQEEIEKKGLAKSHIMILDALLKLRQACIDPRLLSLQSAKKVKGAAKLEWLEETLPSLVAEGRKVLLFSQFATMLGLLEETLSKLGLSYAKLTGDTQDRQQQIQKFQGGQVPIFLISLKAGGVGLNLTAADTVIHYDPWWNPAAENQATDRAHRIGQDKPVFVYKLIVAGSLEEQILKLQERKAELAKGILEGSLGSTGSLSKSDLDMLFAPLEE